MRLMIDGMTFMTVIRVLFGRVLRAGRPHNRRERELLPGHFADHLIGAIRQYAGVPEWFAEFSYQYRIPDVERHHRIEESQPQRGIILAGDDLS